RDALTFGDFFTLNGCRDLILHVQEHNFSVPGIADSLDRLGLRFLGFECDAQVFERFRAMFPGTQSHCDLEAWNRFEENHPQTFKGMYQFWCCKKPDKPASMADASHYSDKKRDVAAAPSDVGSRTNRKYGA